MVDFCWNCDAIIIGKKQDNIICLSCGKENKLKEDINLKQKIINKEIEIIEDINASNIHPITSMQCPKCNHNKSYFWVKQTRSGDEPETQFFKCVKCSNQWRNYK